MNAVTNSAAENAVAALRILGEERPQSFDKAVDEAIRTLRVNGDTSAAAIARMCAWFSTKEREVFARIESVDGQPVIYFVRGTHGDFLPNFLRRQAD
jgi:hypothetical protein